MSTTPPPVTIAVPLWNEAELLPGLLQSLDVQSYPRQRLQILLVDGGSDDGTLAQAHQAAAADHRIAVIANPHRSAAAALNLALARAEGEFFLRLDARARPAEDYIARCVARLQEGEWAGVAGPQKAVGATRSGEVIALALNHPFGVGRPLYRRAAAPVVSETLYLGAHPLARLRAIGGWDERMLANEDYEMNTRLRAAGGQLLVDPAIRAGYLVRENVRELGRQYTRYGAWRTVTWRRHPDAMRLRHAIPALFVLALALAVLALPWSQWPLALVAIPYLLVDLFVSLQLGRRHDWAAIPRLLAIFPVLHLAWGSAFWLALLRSPDHPSSGPPTKE